MKNLFSKTWIILVLTIPVISLNALSGNFSSVEKSVVGDTETTTSSAETNEGFFGMIVTEDATADSVPESNKSQTNNPLYQGNGNSGTNPMHENNSATATRRRVEVLKSNKNAATAAERKGWDGTVKGSSKGINESGIKRTENERKGWDGTVKGGSKGITQNGIKRTESLRNGHVVGNGGNAININTSRAGIKGDNRSSSGNLEGNDATGNGALPVEAQDFNTTRNNKERGQLKTDNSNTSESVQSATTNKITKVQDFNTTRSNRENR